MRNLRTSRANRSWGRTIFPSEPAPGGETGTPGGGRATAVYRGAFRLAAPAALSALVALLLGPVPLSAQQGQEAGQQEAETQERPDRHVVEEGDTLWDLARKYLSDPFQWKDIYELNTDKIEDPHWIYPGQKFLLPGGQVVEIVEKPPEDTAAAEDTVAMEDTAAVEDTAAAPPEPEPVDRAKAFEGPSVFDRSPEQGVSVNELQVEAAERTALVTRSDFYRVAFLADFEQLRPRGKTVRLLEENPLGLQLPPAVRTEDEVMISLSGLNVREGELLQAVRKGRTLEDHGHVIHSMGLLRVSSVRGDSARARVTQVFGGYRVGDPVIVPELYQEPPSRELVPAETELTTRVAGFATEQPLVSTGDVLFLTSGARQGLRLADEFAVFSRSVDDVRSAPIRDRLGVVRVVRLRAESATVRIVETRDVGISPGAPALLIRRVSSGG